MMTVVALEALEGCDCMTNKEEIYDVIQDYCCDCTTCEIRPICDPIHGAFLSNEVAAKAAYEAIRKLKKESPGKNNVNHPSHYQGKHECIDEMIALFGVEAVKAFCKCNVYKYRYRAAAKNGQEDLDKANWYMDKLMELEGE